MAEPGPTVTHPPGEALVRRIGALDGDPGRREAVALGLVDGVLGGDGDTLGAALDALRDARARAGDDAELVGWLDAAIAFAHWGLERVPSPAQVAGGTQAHAFLRGLDDSPHVGSAELRRLLGVDDTQVSRTGRRLLESGLVARRKVGREVFWSLTPRGSRALEEAPASRPGPDSEFWQEALRRGFDGDPLEVDPEREHIVETTLDLHVSQGIAATTWADVARKAGVPEETVRSMFPSIDDLVRSCGRHFLEMVQLPPADRAPEVFAGATSEHDRVHRLVGTFFGAYERAAPGFTAGRRERDLPVVGESVEELDRTLDALVAEALRPEHPDGSSLTSVRALTDVEVWRTLRDQGATPDAAVEQASAAVERWLATRG